MLFMIHAKLKKPVDMSDKEFYSIWLEEAEAATAAMKGGPIKNLWKVAGRPEVIGVLEVDSHDMIDGAMLSLPIWSRGYQQIIEVEWTPLRPYENWHEDLKRLAAG